MIVERIEDERDAVAAVEDVRAVVSELVGDNAFGLAVEAPCGEIEVGVVVEDPGLGLLGRRRAFLGDLLHEVLDGHDRAVDGFVELAIDLERTVKPDGAKCHPSAVVLRGDGRRDRRGRAVDAVALRFARHRE